MRRIRPKFALFCSLFSRTENHPSILKIRGRSRGPGTLWVGYRARSLVFEDTGIPSLPPFLPPASTPTCSLPGRLLPSKSRQKASIWPPKHHFPLFFDIYMQPVARIRQGYVSSRSKSGLTGTTVDMKTGNAAHAKTPFLMAWPFSLCPQPVPFKPPLHANSVA